MKLGTKSHYAVMAMIEIAKDLDQPLVSLNEISTRQKLPLLYLEQLFGKLRKSGLVESVRGPHGGYRLRRGAADIKISDIILGVEESLQAVQCGPSPQNNCLGQSAQCAAHDLWKGLEEHLHSYLKNVSLADVIEGSVSTKNFSSPLPEESPSEKPRKPKSFVYMDYNATAPLRPQAAQAMAQALEQTGNPSSVHHFGRLARGMVERARTTIAENLHVSPSQIIFTSGGTEANTLALRGSLATGAFDWVFISSIEHDSIRHIFQDSGKNADKVPVCRMIPVTPNGIVDLGALRTMLATTPSKVLVSVMYANNETGVIQPVAKIAELVKEFGGVFHCDAVQALGKIPLTFTDSNIDMMTLSAHKIGGPAGAGALIIRKGLPLQSTLKGGGQERGYRAGTENVAAIVGFAKALETFHDDTALIKKHRDLLETLLAQQDVGVIFFGDKAERLGNTSCFTMPGVPQETQLMALDLAGFAVSAGAACSSGKVKSSHVLEAMGIEKSVANTAIRVSLGEGVSTENIHQFAKAWHKIYHRYHGIPETISVQDGMALPGMEDYQDLILNHKKGYGYVKEN